jgi:tetratricopeptide (TPR) repeat protein
LAGREREVASLVRRAKAELRGGHRREALELLQKALAIDPESNAVTEAILQIERESTASGQSEAEPPSRSDHGSGAKRRRTGRKKKKASRKNGAEPPASGDGGEEKPRRRRSRRLRAVPEALEEEIKAAEAEPSETQEEPAEAPESTEKEGSMASTDQLQTLLDTAAEAMRSGNDPQAVKALKRARAMAPDDGRVQDLTRSYKSSRKARKAIQLSRQALADGDPKKATAYARKAFELDSEAPGLDELLEEIEETEGAPATPSKSSGVTTQAGGEADTYVQKIREKIQISSFPEAAKLTEEALDRHPDNELLKTFGEKFRKMGLID